MKRWCRVLLVLGLLGIAPAGRAYAQFEDEQSEPQLREAAGRKTSTQTDEDLARQEAARRAETERQLRRAAAVADLPGSVDPDAYHLGPGDVLELSLWGSVTKTALLAVSPEGTVLLPNAGPYTVDGLTLTQARTDILKRLKSEFRGVSVDLRLNTPRHFRVYVTGRVKTPGPLDATGVSRASDLVLQAEPLENASLRAVEVVHRDGSRDVADLELFLRTGSQSLNPWARDGDVLHVPEAIQFVYLQGAVPRGGRFELGPRDSLRTLLALGGDLLPAADSSRSMLVRWLGSVHQESVTVNPRAVLDGSYNPPLRNGDHFYLYFVPQYQIQNDVTILGQIARPGIYPIRVGTDRVSNIVSAAGGFLPNADLRAVRVRRFNPNANAEDPELQRLLRLSRNELTNSEYAVLQTKLAGLREEYRIDWNSLAKAPDLDVLLTSGDLIQVDRTVNSIRVDGQVRRPGIVQYEANFSVDQYIRATGGYSERAWKSRVRVTRSVTGQTQLAQDVTRLDPGDFIWVPERPDVTLWEQTRQLLGAAAEIATVVLAFHAIR